jgi:hypothetical protein
MGRFSELLAAEQQQASKRRFSELLAREQAGSPDPEVPAAPWHMTGHQIQTQSAPAAPPPQGSTHLADAPRTDILKLGLKANPQDRLAGAKELYPDSIVEPISDGSVVVRRPSGEVYNFDAPDVGNTLIRHARDLIPGLEPEDSNPTVQRSMNEADAAALPELALRGGASAIAAGLTGGASLIPHVLTQAVGGSAAELGRAGINAVTAGGESRDSEQLRSDAMKEGLTAGAGTALLGLAAKPFQSLADNVMGRLGFKNAAARDIAKTMGGTSEGSPALKQITSDVEALGVPAEKAPLSILERANPDAGPRLKEIYSDPKVAKQAAFDERAGQDAVRDASEQAIRDAKAGQRYDVEHGRKSRNLALKEIRKSNPQLDAEIDAAKPRELRGILEKRLPKDDPGVEKLNKSWEDLDQARLRLRQGADAPEIEAAKDTARAVKESGRRVKPDKPKEKLLSAPARLGIRTAVGLGTAGLSEVPGLAAKFARFAKGDKIGRKLITSPEVKNKVLQMLQDGIPDRDISKWLATTGSLTGQEAADD